MGHFRISDFTDDSKPREKLLANGAESLSDSELLAILLGSGTKELNVLELANTILKENGGLSGLRKLGKTELGNIKGIGPAKSAGILASIELGRRFSKSIHENEERQKLKCAEDVYEYIHYEMEHLDHEELRIISLDTKNYVIGEDLLYRGTINTSTLRVAEIFKKPLLLNAASFVMVHNHPSGDPTPSAADIVATRKVIETGITMDLPLLDHVIIGAGKFTSMRNYLP
ncbi:MAG: DNA repair protein RadC [Anaerolineaceae bacterium]|nr:DNA repair protein RadC [Anaerolineaceae bacterium]